MEVFLLNSKISKFQCLTDFSERKARMCKFGGGVNFYGNVRVQGWLSIKSILRVSGRIENRPFLPLHILCTF